MNKNILLVILLLFSGMASAKSSESRMNNTAFFSGIIGSTIPGESETVPDNVDGDQTPKAGVGGSIAAGYKWETFSLELIYTNFGTTENNIADQYTEEHKAYFIGGGLHWTWHWFDLKLGWGTGNDKVSYKKGLESTSFSATPNGQSNSGSGAYFGIGLNFDLGQRTEFIIDYTGYAWNQDDIQSITVDGTSEESEGYMSKMGMLGIGLRRFF